MVDMKSVMMGDCVCSALGNTVGARIVGARVDGTFVTVGDDDGD
jgi:hypothetical protein